MEYSEQTTDSLSFLRLYWQSQYFTMIKLFSLLNKMYSPPPLPKILEEFFATYFIKIFQEWPRTPTEQNFPRKHIFLFRHVHYGGHCCFSCKAFFRRAVNWQNKNKRPFQCKYDAVCEITIKNRKSCQSCRFKVVKHL